MRRALLAVLVAALCLPAGAAAGVPRDFFGVMANGPLDAPGFALDAESAAMRGAGVQTERMEIAWDLAERAPALHRAPRVVGELATGERREPSLELTSHAPRAPHLDVRRVRAPRRLEIAELLGGEAEIERGHSVGRVDPCRALERRACVRGAAGTVVRHPEGAIRLERCGVLGALALEARQRPCVERGARRASAEPERDEDRDAGTNSSHGGSAPYRSGSSMSSNRIHCA